jgi:hypothetical protein
MVTEQTVGLIEHDVFAGVQVLEGLAEALAVEFAFKLAPILVNVDVDLVNFSASRGLEDREFTPSPSRISEESASFPKPVLREPSESFEVYGELTGAVWPKHFGFSIVVAPSFLQPRTKYTFHLWLGNELGGIDAEDCRVDLPIEVIEVEFSLDGDCGFSECHSLLKLTADCLLLFVGLFDGILGTPKIDKLLLNVAESSFKFFILLLDKVDRGLHRLRVEVGKRLVDVAHKFGSECLEWIFF